MMQSPFSCPFAAVSGKYAYSIYLRDGDTPNIPQTEGYLLYVLMWISPDSLWVD